MRLTRPLIVTLGLLLLAGPALAQKVALRGPAPKAGDTIVTTADTESDKGTMNMNFQGQAMQGEMSTKAHQVVEVKVLEAEADGPTKVQTTFVKSKTTNEVTIFGQTQNQDDTSMEGMVITQTKTDDGWETTTKGGQMDPQARDIMKKAGYVDPRLAFPAEPVAVGHTWEVKGDQIGAFLGQGSLPGAKYEGSIKFKLAEVKNVGGNEVAIIDYEMDSAMIMDMAQEGMQLKMRIDMDGKGSIERDLSLYTSANVFGGDMTVDTTMSANGQQMMSTKAKLGVKTSMTQEAK